MRNTALLTLICFLLFATSCQKEELEATTDLEIELREDFPNEGEGNPPHESNPCWDGVPNNLRVLFIGNSFTDNYTVDIPTMFHELAIASGQIISTVVTAAVNGYTLSQHKSSPTTLGYINQGDWDYVILQENSGYLANATTANQGFTNSVESLVNLINPGSPNAKILLYRVVPPVEHSDPQYDVLDQDWQLLFDDVASNHPNVTTTNVAGAFTEAYHGFGTFGLVGGSDILRLPTTYQYHFLNTGGFLTAATFYADIFHDKPCVPTQMTFWLGGNAQGLDNVNSQVLNMEEILQVGYVQGYNSSTPTPLPSDCPQYAMYSLGNGPC